MENNIYGTTNSLYYSEIASALRDVHSVTTMYHPSEMGAAVRDIVNAASNFNMTFYTQSSFFDLVFTKSCRIKDYVDSSNFYRIANGSSCLTAVSFPDCSYIGSYAFNNCPFLQVAYFPNCSYIGSYAFNNCVSLKEIIAPRCEYIGAGAFRSCSLLERVEFPLCSYIGSYAFDQCSSLGEIIAPDCSYVGTEAFGGCPLSSTFPFPKCTYIGSSAFTGRVFNTITLSMCSYIGNDIRCTTLFLPGSSICSTGYVYQDMFIVVPSDLLSVYRATQYSVGIGHKNYVTEVNYAY